MKKILLVILLFVLFSPLAHAKKCSNKQSPEERSDLGFEFRDKDKNYKKSLECFKLNLNLNVNDDIYVMEAYESLGWAYNKGLGVKKD